MKIAVIARSVIRDLARSTDGGPDWQLIKAYRDAGHHIVVLSQHEENHRSITAQDYDGIPIIAHPRWKRPWKTAIGDKLLKPFFGHRKPLSDALAVLRFLDEYGPFDVVDARNEEADGLPMALANQLGAMPPWAVQIFGLPYSFHGERLSLERQKIYGWMFAQASVIRANSQMVADLLQKHYRVDHKKIRIVHHNIGNAWESQPAPQLQDLKASQTIVCLAAINQKKGADLFIQAAQSLIPHFPKAQFTLIGGITASDGFAEHWLPIAKALAPNLSLTGKIPPQEVAQHLRSAHAVIIPSRFDEFNRAALEAILLAPRVLISSACGIVDHLPHDAAIHFFNPTVDSITHAIRQVLTSANLAAISDHTRKQIQHDYSTPTIAQKNLAALQSLIKNLP